MKIHVLSDLHLEFGPFRPPHTDADVVVLAGDIDLGTRGIEWAKAEFSGKRVLYVAGNHEFYRGHWVKTLQDLRVAADGSNVTLLENDTVVIDGVRFMGGSLWTDFNLLGIDTRHEAMQAATRLMTDYRKIRAPRYKAGLDGDYAKLMPIQTVDRFKATRDYLIQNLADSFSGPTVVVTHHAPCSRSLPRELHETLGSAAYASNLLRGLGHAPEFWIHGHIHSSSNYFSCDTRVVCNPRGYAEKTGRFLNAQFISSFLLEI
jgi:predicted phosphohydrolase